jgi:hypothetical protein
MRWVLRKPDGWQGFHPATGEPQADAFEEGAHPCSMGSEGFVYTRSTHTGVGKPGSVKAMSAMGIRENFTVDGLPDGEVCIGDRYRIGSAVFEVTQR